jgi:hypothetical protein
MTTPPFNVTMGVQHALNPLGQKHEDAKMRSLAIACLAGLLIGPGCISVARPPVPPAALGGVVLVSPRCAGVSSCLLGQVVAAESARPMARAAVFLQREDAGADRSESVRIMTLTDDQGVFTVEDAPVGKYRLAVYKDARSLEVRGLSLGARGTTMVPVRLPPG